MIQTGDLKFDALIGDLQQQLTALSEGKALYAVRIKELEARVQQLETVLSPAARKKLTGAAPSSSPDKG